ncbi:hypothetical protein HYU22_02500 [Candidatus Woesearchaeota archaeon]|nr:hypothetical protein [Candidatus Woesearchaeota archaeon]
MRKKMVEVEGLTFIFIAVLLVVLFLKTFPAPTAFVVYQEAATEKVWNFADATDYSYDTSQISLSNGRVQLIPVTTTTTSTTQTSQNAVVTSSTLHNPGQDPHDKTSIVQSQDGEAVTIQKGTDVLDVTFDTALNNGDSISLYLLKQKKVTTEVYLCDAGTVCSSPGYGAVTFNEDEGWYNITLSGLPAPMTTFGIDPPHHLKVDYVSATYMESTTQSITTTSYPSSAAVRTADIQPANLKSFGTFSAVHQLNGQQLTYSYSIDAGATWTQVPVNGNLSSASGTKIRFKAQLESDGSATPIVTQMKVQYTTQKACTENWACTDWSPANCPVNGVQTRTCTDSNACGSTDTKPVESTSCTYVPSCVENWTLVDDACRNDDTRLKSYTDANNCGTTSSLPADNGTAISCDYCSPSWDEINGSCTVRDTFITSYIDSNTCYAQTHLASDALAPTNQTNACDYCAPDWVPKNESCEPDNLLTGSFIDVNSCYAATNLESDNLLPNAVKYSCDYCASHNCSSSAKVEPTPYQEGNATLWKIDSRNLTGVSLEIDATATPEEVSILHYDYNILKIHYYNETSKSWEELNSIVNTTGNYVYAIVPHFSLYGLFGQVPATAGSSSSSGGGGGGSGSVRRSTAPAETPSVVEQTQAVLDQPVKTDKPAVPESLSGTACNYVVEISLPEELSFTSADTFSIEAVNTGNCNIPFLTLSLSPELAQEIDLPSARTADVQPGGKSTFTLIRRQEKKTGLLSSVTGSVIMDFGKSKTITGSVIVDAVADNQEVFHKSLPVSIRVLDPVWVMNMKFIAGINMLVIVFALVVIVLRRKGKQ